MDGATVGQIVVAFLALLSVYVQYRTRDRGARSQLKRDAELLQLLPDASDARQLMEQHVTHQIRLLVRDETVKKRDPSGITIGVIFIVLGAYLAFLTLQGGWWWLLSPLTILVLIVGLVGFGVSVGKAERDLKGNRVKTVSAESGTTTT